MKVLAIRTEHRIALWWYVYKWGVLVMALLTGRDVAHERVLFWVKKAIKTKHSVVEIDVPTQ